MEEQIKNTYRAWNEAFNHKDSEKLTSFYSDNAKEYESDNFKSLYNNKGILSTYSTPYSP